MENKIHLTECPRDAMQGIHEFIPTAVKIEYLKKVLACGFDTVDIGSFVSPKAIPQMRDTAEVLRALHHRGDPKLLAIIANLRGAEDACAFDEISFLGFPFSISETFQRRNTNAGMEESLKRVEEIRTLAEKRKKTVLVYISMAFGNPYGETWNGETAIRWTERLAQSGITHFAMADTIGVSTPSSIRELFTAVLPEFPGLHIGAHLHTTPGTWREKVEAAWLAGCRKFDSAIRGFGGCPMATDQLTGNMPTENLLSYFEEQHVKLHISKTAFASAMKHALSVFPS